MALEALAGHQRVRYGRLAGHSPTRDRPVSQYDGVKGDGADINNEQLVDQEFAGVGVFVAVCVDPFTTIDDRFAYGEIGAATPAGRMGISAHISGSVGKHETDILVNSSPKVLTDMAFSGPSYQYGQRQPATTSRRFFERHSVPVFGALQEGSSPKLKLYGILLGETTTEEAVSDQIHQTASFPTIPVPLPITSYAHRVTKELLHPRRWR